jgi:protein TonB
MTSAVSAVGHATVIGLLVLLSGLQRRPPVIIPVQLVFTPPPEPPAPEQVAEPPKTSDAPPPPPEETGTAAPPLASEPPRPVESQPALSAPAPLAASSKPPPPPPKPVQKPRPRPAVRDTPVERAPAAPSPAPAVTTPPQVAAVPPPPPQSPAPSAVVSTQYRSLLAGWLEAHKRYPDRARQRGEEGRAVLRFRVDRSGRVLGFTVIGSTGNADLDAAVAATMRGATMPAFPAGMVDAEIEATVTIRFSLAH